MANKWRPTAIQDAWRVYAYAGNATGSHQRMGRASDIGMDNIESTSCGTERTMVDAAKAFGKTADGRLAEPTVPARLALQPRKDGSRIPSR
jgi:hypothetical protein